MQHGNHSGPSASLAVDPPERVDGSFIDEELASHQTDLLYKIRLTTGGEAFVYTLLEHKSAPDPAIHLQLQRYMNQIWQKLASDREPGQSLPVILPVVLYHGIRPWNVPLDFAARLQDVPDALRSYVPDFHYHLIDLSQIPDDELSDNQRLRVGLRVMKHIQRADFLASLTTVLAELHRLDPLDVTAILNYIIKKWRQKLEHPVIEHIEALLPAERKDQIMGSVVSEWLAEGEAKGIEKGKAEGKAELLIRLLERRFGVLPGDVKERIMSADADRLELWFDLAVDAPTLAAVFGPSGKAEH